MEKILELIESKIRVELNSITSNSDYDSDEIAIQRANELVILYFKVKGEM